MSECTHDCHTCGSGCHSELPEGAKPKDVLEELKKFVNQCDTEEMDNFFAEMAKEME